MSLLCEDNVDSRARREKSWRNAPVALRVTVYRCFVKRSLGMEHNAEVSNMGTPRNSSLLKLG